MDARTKIQFYKSIYKFRPAGIHKHLHMLTISAQVGVPPSTLWAEIEAMYNTEKADALEKELDEVDFHNQMVAHFYPEMEERRLGDEDDEAIKSESELSESPNESRSPSEKSPDPEQTGTRRRSSRIQAQVVAPAKPAKTSARKARKRAEPEPEPQPEPEPEPSRALRPRRGRSAAPAAPPSPPAPPAKKAKEPPKKKARRR